MTTNTGDTRNDLRVVLGGAGCFAIHSFIDCVKDSPRVSLLRPGCVCDTQSIFFAVSQHDLEKICESSSGFEVLGSSGVAFS